MAKSSVFPDPRLAGAKGIVAVGGSLTPEILIDAYIHGIFPWFNPGEIPMWWSPDPRYVVFPDRVKVSGSMRALLRKAPWTVTLDTSFDEVIRACAGPSLGRREEGTWISASFIEAYHQLHLQGFAHSLEVRDDGHLIAGLYGVSLGPFFFGESMFTRVSNASKYGFVHLARLLKARGFLLIDGQVATDHLISLGAEPMPRDTFLDLLEKEAWTLTHRGSWTSWIADSPPDKESGRDSRSLL